MLGKGLTNADIEEIVTKFHQNKQCDYETSRAENFRTHLKNHSGEKSNKCNQCDYASPHASNLRTHLKTQSVEAKQMQTM